jgi:hypothetical protein
MSDDSTNFISLETVRHRRASDQKHAEILERMSRADLFLAVAANLLAGGTDHDEVTDALLRAFCRLCEDEDDAVERAREMAHFWFVEALS